MYIRPTVAGIAFVETDGAYSVALSGVCVYLMR